jgi:hypothetical protein
LAFLRRVLDRPGRDLAFVILGAAMVAVVVFTGDIRDTKSDPYATLLVSQAIVQHGTVRLDDYAPSLNFNHHGIKTINGHVYSWYPLGTPVFSIPFVAGALALGYDMRRDEGGTQIAIAALISVLVFIALYLTARNYLPPVASLFLAGLSFFGSSLTSSMATGLWNSDFTTFFCALLVLVLALWETEKIERPCPYLLTILAFAAYFSKPTGAIPAFLVFVYLLVKRRELAIKYGAILGLLFWAFVLFSYLQFGRALPEYYDPRLMSGPISWTSLKGVLVSPSRGLFVYSPFFLLSLAGGVLFFKELRKNPLFWFSLAWFGFHAFTAAKRPQWWGGWCFGPRLMMEAIPSLVLLTILAGREAFLSKKKILKGALVAGFVLLGLWGVFVNVKQGLHNFYAADAFNKFPDMNENPEYIMDWRYPQFLADEKMVTKRLLEIIRKGEFKGL